MADRARTYAALRRLERDQAGKPEGDAAKRRADALLAKFPELGRRTAAPSSAPSSSSAPPSSSSGSTRDPATGLRQCNRCGEWFTPMIYGRTCPWCSSTKIDNAEREGESPRATFDRLLDLMFRGSGD